DEHPDGAERLYADGEFWSAPDYCESYGRDMVTGAPLEEIEYRAMNPDGKAIIKAAQYLPPHELPSAERPFQRIAGRTLYHFDTRTEAVRAAQLQAAAPEVWGEMAPTDAAERGLAEGDLVEITTPRGRVVARL